MTSRETKRRWALHYRSAWGWSPWPAFTFTARGREKAIRKLMRRIDRRPGVAMLVDLHPDLFSLEVVS